MKNECKIDDILWRVKFLCNTAILHKEEKGKFWNAERTQAFVEMANELSYFMNNPLFEQKPDEYVYERTRKRFVDNIEPIINLLFDVWHNYDDGDIPDEIPGLLMKLATLQESKRKELEEAKAFIHVSPPKQNEEERQYDARLLAYYRNDKKACELFYNELAKTKPLTPKAVKDAFVRFNPDIKKLYVGELANFLEEITGITISRTNMASITKWCNGKGIPVYKNPNKSHMKKEC